MKTIVLFFAITFSFSLSFANTNKCVDFFAAEFYQEYVLLQKNEFNFSNYESFLAIYDTKILHHSMLENKIAPPLDLKALEVVDSYEPAIYYVIEGYRQLHDPKDPESAELIEGYYDLLIEHDITGPDFVTFSNSIKNDAIVGLHILAEGHDLLQKNHTIH